MREGLRGLFTGLGNFWATLGLVFLAAQPVFSAQTQQKKSVALPRLTCGSIIEEQIVPLAPLRLIRTGGIILPAGTTRERANRELNSYLEAGDAAWAKVGTEDQTGSTLPDTENLPYGTYVAGVNPISQGRFELFAGRLVGANSLKHKNPTSYSIALQLEMHEGRRTKVVFAPGAFNLHALASNEDWSDGYSEQINAMPHGYSEAILHSPLSGGYLAPHLREAMDDYFRVRAEANLRVLAGLDVTWVPAGSELPVNGVQIAHPAILIGRTVVGVVTNDYDQVWIISGRVTEYEDRNGSDPDKLPDWWAKIACGPRGHTCDMNLSGAQSLFVKKRGMEKKD